MALLKLTLKHFRNHKTATFSFPLTTVIIGKNTVGKTSVLEAIQFLSHGKSFKADKDIDVIATGSEFARIEAKVEEPEGPLRSQSEARKTALVIIIANIEGRMSKKFLVNNVARRHAEFASHFTSVLFTPEDLEIITDSPSLRRNYVNLILSQSDKKYRIALGIYEKALRQRNKMLWLLREGKKYYGPSEFEYWDNILITNGTIITDLRNEFVEYVNRSDKEVFQFDLFYDKSIISRERLDHYHDAERASATTLVGPNRDDFFFYFPLSQRFISEFGSRGEQRLTIFQMKIIETQFLMDKTEKAPVLLLDDIFSELDDGNIHKVLELLPVQQTIITTTHKEFVPKKILDKEEVEIIEL